MSDAIAVIMAVVYLLGVGVAGGIAAYHFKRGDDDVFLLAVAWPLVLIGVVAAVPVCLGIVVARTGVWIYTRIATRPRLPAARTVKGS